MDLIAIGLHLPRDLGTKRLPWRTAIRFVNHLSETSAVARAKREFKPTIDTLLLRRVEHTARMLYWAETKDAEHGRNMPVPVPLHGDNSNEKRRDAIATNELLARRQAKREAELLRLKEGR